MKKEKKNKNITKIYVSSVVGVKLLEKDIHYLVMSNQCFPLSVKKLTTWNWIVELEYDKYEDLINILKTKLIRKKGVNVKRIFKSMKLNSSIKAVYDGFIDQIIMGISGLIKKPVNIRITNNRAGDWQKEMTKRWQEEIDNPDKFKKAGIKCVVDIHPKGELRFCIVKGDNYLVTFFDEIIDEYI